MTRMLTGGSVKGQQTLMLLCLSVFPVIIARNMKLQL